MSKKLLVDDSPTETHQFKSMLELMGHEVVAADNGRDGVSMAIASKPSVAVMTSHPSLDSKVSAVLRIVFESSMTITFTALKLSSIAPTLVPCHQPLRGFHQQLNMCKVYCFRKGRSHFVTQLLESIHKCPNRKGILSQNELS